MLDTWCVCGSVFGPSNEGFTCSSLSRSIVGHSFGSPRMTLRCKDSRWIWSPQAYSPVKNSPDTARDKVKCGDLLTYPERKRATPSTALFSSQPHHSSYGSWEGSSISLSSLIVFPHSPPLFPSGRCPERGLAATAGARSSVAASQLIVLPGFVF